MPQLGYCTNVHAGPNLQQTQANLQQHAEAVRRQFSPDAPMGVGLWLAAPAAAELCQDERQLATFREYLNTAGLIPFTLNGFPYGDFHQDVVKHAVYQPTWMEATRADYTRNLLRILDTLLPAGMQGTISTLPIAWGDVRHDADALRQAAGQLASLAAEMHQTEKQTGRELSICIEPEPGCVMDRAEHIVEFFEQHLLPIAGERSIDEPVVRRHIRVCHDVCHSAVMFEPQSQALETYRSAGIQVGKVQVSSAVSAPLGELDQVDRDAVLEELSAFNEPRYLHQTTHCDADGQLHFFEDLAPALEHLQDESNQNGEVRVHFHVPIYLESFGALRTTRDDVLACLADVETEHFEVETYAWGVLPAELQFANLADGIAKEMDWFRSVL